MIEHPYAPILRAIADGKEVQLKNHSNNGSWETLEQHVTLRAIGYEDYLPEDFRVKPETININGHEVPKPLDVMPEEGTEVSWPSFTEDGMAESVEVGYYPEVLSELLRKGLLHLTKEAAEAHAKALVSFTQKV